MNKGATAINTTTRVVDENSLTYMPLSLDYHGEGIGRAYLIIPRSELKNLSNEQPETTD